MTTTTTKSLVEAAREYCDGLSRARGRKKGEKHDLLSLENALREAVAVESTNGGERFCNCGRGMIYRHCPVHGSAPLSSHTLSDEGVTKAELAEALLMFYRAIPNMMQAGKSYDCRAIEVQPIIEACHHAKPLIKRMTGEK